MNDLWYAMRALRKSPGFALAAILTLAVAIAADCVVAAQTVGLDVAGIDLIAADIGRPLEEQGGAIRPGDPARECE